MTMIISFTTSSLPFPKRLQACLYQSIFLEKDIVAKEEIFGIQTQWLLFTEYHRVPGTYSKYMYQLFVPLQQPSEIVSTY